MKSRESQRHYNQSEKGKARNLRYEQSEKGLAARKRYTTSGRRAESNKNWYHRIQDEAGYHRDPRLWYPGYRFLKALQENPEVVEIKP